MLNRRNHKYALEDFEIYLVENLGLEGADFTREGDSYTNKIIEAMHVVWEHGWSEGYEMGFDHGCEEARREAYDDSFFSHRVI